MRVLVVTAMYPSKAHPAKGTFVQEQVESLRAEGLYVEVLPFAGNGSIKNYFKAGFKLRKLLSEREFDVVHAHYGLAGLPALMQNRHPVVITYHGSDLLGEVNSTGHYTLPGWIKVRLGKAFGLWAKEKIVVAHLQLPLLWGKPGTVIPMGVDMATFKPMPKKSCRFDLDLPQDKPLLLFPANPTNGVKRFDLASAAVELVRKSIPEIQLIPVFGVEHEKIPLYMNACDGLILTSNHEASPCVVKEALACNLPIVSVDVGDVAERLQDVEGCFLCDRSVESVAEGILKLFRFGKRTDGRDKVADINLQNTARRTIEVFRRAIKY